MIDETKSKQIQSRVVLVIILALLPVAFLLAKTGYNRFLTTRAPVVATVYVPFEGPELTLILKKNGSNLDAVVLVKVPSGEDLSDYTIGSFNVAGVKVIKGATSLGPLKAGLTKRVFTMPFPAGAKGKSWIPTSYTGSYTMSVRSGGSGSESCSQDLQVE